MREAKKKKKDSGQLVSCQPAITFPGTLTPQHKFLAMRLGCICADEITRRRRAWCLGDDAGVEVKQGDAGLTTAVGDWDTGHGRGLSRTNLKTRGWAGSQSEAQGQKIKFICPQQCKTLWGWDFRTREQSSGLSQTCQPHSLDPNTGFP